MSGCRQGAEAGHFADRVPRYDGEGFLAWVPARFAGVCRLRFAPVLMEREPTVAVMTITFAHRIYAWQFGGRPLLLFASAPWKARANCDAKEGGLDHGDRLSRPHSNHRERSICL